MANLPAIIQEKGLPVIKTAQELHAMVHEVFTPDKYNVLVPKAMNISPKVKVAIEIVEMDPEPDFNKNKHFWSMDGNEAIFRANAIRKLSSAANVRFIPDLTGLDGEPAYDKNGQVTRVRFKAVCQVIDPKGVIKEGTGVYEYNYNEDLKNLKQKQVNQRRRYAVQLAETGAKKRAFFECLGQVDRSISKSDIGKPFIVPCVVDDIDYDDPIVREIVAKRALGAKNDTYGKAVDADYEVVKDDLSVDTQTGEVTQQPQEPPAEPKAEPKAPVQRPRDAYKKDWETSSSGERAREIKRLADMAKFDITKDSKGKPRVSPDEWADVDQMNWLMYLAQLAGKIE